MTIKYKVNRTTLGEQEHAYPQLVQGETVTTQKFERKVAQKAARGLADVVAVFIAASEVLCEGLREEQAVQVPGIGLFTLTLRGELDEDERLVTQSARLKVSLRAERELTDGVNTGQGFEYVGD
jgi:nucleoid DNA-binding protein